MVDFSYSGDPSSSVLDELRFIVQDTDPAVPLLTNTEMTYLLTKWMPLYDSVTYVAAVSAAIISRKFAGITDVSADGVSVSTAGISERYTAMAEKLREEYAEEGATGGLPLIDNILSGHDFDPSIEPLEFGLHMHDNIYAGRQNYGGAVGGPTFDWSDRSWSG